MHIACCASVGIGYHLATCAPRRVLPLPQDAADILGLDKSDELIVLPGGHMRMADGADGLVMSSGKLLTNIREASQPEAWGERVPGSCDGTYKIHRGNFVLIIFGTVTLKTNARNEIVTSLRPLSFALAKSESEVCLSGLIRYVFSTPPAFVSNASSYMRGTRQSPAVQFDCSFIFIHRTGRSQLSYTKLFRCTVEAGKLLYGVDLKVAAMVSDHSYPAFNAAQAMFPGVTRVICWPHISREVRVWYSAFALFYTIPRPTACLPAQPS